MFWCTYPYRTNGKLTNRNITLFFIMMRTRFWTFWTDSSISLHIRRNAGFLSRTCLILLLVMSFFWMSFWKRSLSMPRNSGVKLSTLRRPWRYDNVRRLMLLCLLREFIYYFRSPISTYMSVDCFGNLLFVRRFILPPCLTSMCISRLFLWNFPSISRLLLRLVDLFAMDFVLLFLLPFPGLGGVGGITSLRKQYIFLELTSIAFLFCYTYWTTSRNSTHHIQFPGEDLLC